MRPDECWGAGRETANCGFREEDFGNKMTLNSVFGRWTGVSKLERKFQAQFKSSMQWSSRGHRSGGGRGRGGLEVGGGEPADPGGWETVRRVSRGPKPETRRRGLRAAGVERSWEVGSGLSAATSLLRGKSQSLWSEPHTGPGPLHSPP